VAIKVILPDFATDESFRALFVQEARVGSVLHHQNLVQIQDFDREGKLYYLVMEYVEGFTLRRAISLCKRQGLAPILPVIADIGRQICDGLHHAHTAAFIIEPQVQCANHMAMHHPAYLARARKRPSVARAIAHELPLYRAELDRLARDAAA
jgi:serine/threonine protein kinase